MYDSTLGVIGAIEALAALKRAVSISLSVVVAAVTAAAAAAVKLACRTPATAQQDTTCHTLSMVMQYSYPKWVFEVLISITRCGTCG
jgi:hypothetical protein